MRTQKLKRLQKLHKLIIHDKTGTSREYYLESREIAKLDNHEAGLVCKRCFKRRDKNSL